MDPRISFKDRILNGAKKTLEYVVVGAVLTGCIPGSSSSGDGDSTDKPNPENPEKPEVPRNSVVYYVDDTGKDSNSGKFDLPISLKRANELAAGAVTFYLRAGDYNESIFPLKSGTSSKPVIYENFGSDIVNVRGNKKYTAAVNLGKKSNVIVKGIRITNPARRYADLTGASYCTLEGIIMKGIKGKEQAVTLGTYGTNVNIPTHHNKIIDCEITGYDTEVSAALETISLFYNAHNNLIEGCTITNADHVAIYLKGLGNKLKAIGPHHNVISDCVIVNPLHHSIAEGYGANNNLYQFLSILQSGSNNADDAEGIHLAPNDGLFRHVVITESGSRDVENRLEGGAGFAWNALRGKHYFSGGNIFAHCTLTGNRGPGVGVAIGVSGEDCAFYSKLKSSEFVNSIISGNAKNVTKGSKLAEIIYRGWQSTDCIDQIGKKELVMPQDVYRYNIIGEFSGQKVIKVEGFENSGFFTIKEAERFLPLNFIDNEGASPNFVNERNSDYSLSNQSPAIDSGDFLTSAQNGGNGSRELRVRNARYFVGPPVWDPFVIKPDYIQIGNQVSLIKEIDYLSNTIYLHEALNWNKGDGVSYEYKGLRPDRGAFESDDNRANGTIDIDGNN